MNNISFPKLNIKFDVNPIAIDFPFLGGIYWYGIIIALGILLGFLYSSALAKKEGEKSDTVTDILLYSIPVSVICARIYYVAFSWESYKNNLSSIYKIWEGGIAIYGAVIGAVLTAFIYCRVKKLNILKIFDICCLGLMIGQLVGRWGNFVNCEAYGGPCSALWGMSINGGAPVHPTFLYESLWNLIGLIILSVLHKKRPFYGFTFFNYLSWYGVGRFFIEGLRTDSLYIGAMRISQIVAIGCVIGGIYALSYLSEKNIARKATRE